MFDPITAGIVWILFAGGAAAVATFWDEIKAWAERVLARLIDGLRAGVERATRAVTKLIKKGKIICKRVQLYFLRNGESLVTTTTEPLSINEEAEMSAELESSVNSKGEVTVSETNLR